MKVSVCTLLNLFFLIHASVCTAQGLLIDRQDVHLFDSIPEEYKYAAASQRMLFMDRSVGFNISTYLDCLSEPWADAPSYCSRYEHQDPIYSVDPEEVYWNETWDRTEWKYAFWPGNCSEDVTCFISYMEDRLDSFDVFGCQFSYLAVLPGANIADSVTGFFGQQGNDNKAETYAAFAAQHPDKKIIWWTTSLARGIGTPESESFNSQMRDYAAVHDIILFDVADILSHDPAGNPCYDNRDGITYKDEDHPDDSLNIPAICPQYTTETEGGHLGAISAGGIRVAKAFWVLMARLAGWEEETSPVSVIPNRRFKISPNPASDFVKLEFDFPVDVSKAELFLFDGLGDLKSRIRLNDVNANEYEGLEITLENLSSGLYILQLRTSSMCVSQKLIVMD